MTPADAYLYATFVGLSAIGTALGVLVAYLARLSYRTGDSFDAATMALVASLVLTVCCVAPLVALIAWVLQ